MTEPAETKTVTVLGRDIACSQPTPLQATVMGRTLFRAMDTVGELGPDEDMTQDQLRVSIEAIGMFLDVVDALIIDPADRSWLEKQIIGGKIATFTDLQPLLKAFDMEVPTPNRTARRARK